MANKLLSEAIIEKKKTRKLFRLSMPKLTGKFGFSVFTGSKEVFIGIAVADVEIEKVIRRKILKTSKGNVKVFNFD